MSGAVQIRNNELVDLLRPDFVARNDSPLAVASGPNAILEKSATYAIATSDFVVGGWLTIVYTGVADGTITLPALSNAYSATYNTGLVVNVKYETSSSVTITIDGNGAETIDGATTQTLVSRYGNLQLQAGPSEWSII